MPCSHQHSQECEPWVIFCLLVATLKKVKENVELSQYDLYNVLDS